MEGLEEVKMYNEIKRQRDLTNWNGSKRREEGGTKTEIKKEKRKTKTEEKRKTMTMRSKQRTALSLSNKGVW